MYLELGGFSSGILPDKEVFAIIDKGLPKFIHTGGK